MAETSYPIADGAGVTEHTYEKLMAQVTGIGRINLVGSTGAEGGASIADKLVYADTTGRQVKIKANAAYMIRGFRWDSGTDVIVRPLDANTSGKTRIDRIVLRLDRSDWTVRLAVLKGTAADVPAAPAVTVGYLSTGVLEVPIAKVTVTSNAGSGLPSITAANVVDETTWLAPNRHVGSVEMMNPTMLPGETYAAVDQGRIYAGMGVNESVIMGERGAFTTMGVAGGWNPANLYCQRVNGWTFLQCQVVMSSTAKAPSTDLLVATLPPLFRPNKDFVFHCGMSPGQVGFGAIDSTSGAIRVTAYPETFPNGGKIIFGPWAYPSTLAVS